MSMLLRGAPAAAALNEKTAQLVSGLREKGVVRRSPIVRLGAREDDLSYERAAVKRCAAVGIETRCVSLPENVSGEALEETLRSLSADASVHGILLLRPLPAALDEARILRAIAPEKDVDGAADGSLAAVYAGTDEGFAPCTAQAVLELLDYYEIPIEGKRAVVLGRSLVVGRPAAMLLLHRGATVTLCHSKTENAAALRAKRISSSPRPGGARASARVFPRRTDGSSTSAIHYNEETQKLCATLSSPKRMASFAPLRPCGRRWRAHHGGTGRAHGKSRGAPDKINSIQKTHDRVGAKRKVPRDGMLSVDEAAGAARFCSASAATRGYRSFRGNCHERSLFTP